MKITIITPVFNGQLFLPETVASLQAQTFSDWEWIIVNDGSTDETAAYLDALTDPRIQVLHQPNRGVSAARNVGLDLAKGEFVTFLDADDAFPKRSLEARLKFFEQNPEVSVVDGRILIKDAALQVTLNERVGGTKGPYFSRLIRMDSTVFFGVAVMVRRSALEPNRFQVDLSHCEDLLFLLQAANSNSWVYGAIDEPVYFYRMGNSSAMTQLEGLETGYQYLYERCHEFEEATPADLAYLYRRIRRIMLRSWLRRGQPLKAFQSWRRMRELHARVAGRRPSL